MADTQLATRPDTAIESVLIQGDLSKLTPEQRVKYYLSVCESVGLNPLTKPFQYITLNGKLVLYALKDCTDQLRANKNVSITKLEKERQDDLYIVTAYAQLANGRMDSSTGAVCLTNKRGDDLANALMKAETKAKRRVTLSICGLGMLDETEVETIPNAQPVTITIEQPTGETTTPAPASKAQEQTKALEQPALRFAPDVLKEKIAGGVIKNASKTIEATKTGLIATVLETALSFTTDPKASRKQLLVFLVGKDSLRDLDAPTLVTLYNWLAPNKDTGGEWRADPMAEREAIAAFNACQPAQESLL